MTAHPRRRLPGLLAVAVPVAALFACGGEAPAPGGPAPVLEDRSGWPERELRDEPFDVLHYRISLDLDETDRSMVGVAEVRIEAEQEIARVALDAETFVVARVRVRGRQGELDFTHADGVLDIRLAEPLAADEQLTLVISYGALGMEVDSTRYGMPASYDLGLDFKAAGEEDGNPLLINTLSFPEGARHWYPSVDHPADRATFELLATVREDWKVLSNGRLLGVSEGHRPGTRTHHWSLEEPHPTYLSVLVAGPYEVLEDRHGDIPVNYWVYPHAVPDAPRSFHKTPAMLAFFEEEYGVPYPWNKYDQITIPGIGGGAESTTATVLGQRTIHDERAEQDFPSHGLVAHEAAHHWWGNLISYRDWGDTWLSESFATWSEYRWHAEELGPDEAGENMRRKRQSYFNQARTVLRPVVTNRWRRPNDNFGPHTYPKGAALIHLLRSIVGPEEFHAGLRHFLERHAFEPADTGDFVASFAETPGVDIGWFVDLWLRRPGHPILEIASRWDEAGGEVVMEIRQVQTPEASMGEVPAAYRAPLAVRIFTANGSSRHPFVLDGREQTVRFPGPEEPRFVRFDADDVLLAELRITKSVEEWALQLEADDAAGRRRAAVALGRVGTVEARTLLRTAAANDPFWAVREAALAGLDPARPEDAAVLRHVGEDDERSAVRAAAIGRLGTAADTPYLVERYRTDSSYRVQAAAAAALLASGDPAAGPTLEDARNTPSPRDVLRRAATPVSG